MHNQIFKIQTYNNKIERSRAKQIPAAVATIKNASENLAKHNRENSNSKIKESKRRHSNRLSPASKEKKIIVQGKVPILENLQLAA